MYMFIDTEGSGLFDFKRDADAPGQPRLAEIAMLFVNADLERTGEYHAYIQPNGWEMDPKATEVNGLTTEFLMAHGQPIEMALAVYTNAIKVDGRAVIAHNAQHDLKQIRAELRLAGLPDLFEETPNVCTMRGAMALKVKKLNGKGGFPRLIDLCGHFGIPYDDQEAHSAMYDVIACHRCLRRMVADGFELKPEVHFSKNLDAIRANR